MKLAENLYGNGEFLVKEKGSLGTRYKGMTLEGVISQEYSRHRVLGKRLAG